MNAQSNAGLGLKSKLQAGIAVSFSNYLRLICSVTILLVWISNYMGIIVQNPNFKRVYGLFFEPIPAIHSLLNKETAVETNYQPLDNSLSTAMVICLDYQSAPLFVIRVPSLLPAQEKKGVYP